MSVIFNAYTKADLQTKRMTVLTEALKLAANAGACSEYADALVDSVDWTAEPDPNRSVCFQVADNILEMLSHEATIEYTGDTVLEMLNTFGVDIGSKVGVTRENLIAAARDKWDGFADDISLHEFLKDRYDDAEYLEHFTDVHSIESVREHMLERYLDYQMDEDIHNSGMYVVSDCGDWVIS